ncbi:hypothetical protein RIF29_26313 [Crotalaria pallida]|uniref:Ubiquitin-like protease family profile domain-containing protein n=1 Tax=Crotalaria pallida TaxID=3830 RepID=A0AAN9EN67_CROPI
MDKFVEDPVVNLDDDNSTSNESGGEEHDELGDKNGPTEVAIIPQDEEGNNFSFLNYKPLNSCKHPGRTTGIEIPEWMPTLFPIPASMILDEIEAAVSLYIFGSNKDDQKSGKEVLINYTCWGQGNRETLKSLMSNKEVDQEIFLPINDEKHWYLLVVDMSKQQLILLDSKPDRKRSMWRRLYVQKMVLPKSRMRIAIDLVLSPYSKKKEEIVPKAVQNWEDLKTKRKNLVKKGLED